MTRSLFFLASLLVFAAGCVPIEKPVPVPAASVESSAGYSGDLNRESGGETPASPFLSPFQLKGVSDILDIKPQQFIVCERKEDRAAFAFYFYERDEAGAVCSFLLYNRIHQKEGGEYIEISERIDGSENEGCLSPAQEKISVKRQTGWSCKNHDDNEAEGPQETEEEGGGGGEDQARAPEPDAEPDAAERKNGGAVPQNS